MGTALPLPSATACLAALASDPTGGTTLLACRSGRAVTPPGLPIAGEAVGGVPPHSAPDRTVPGG